MSEPLPSRRNRPVPAAAAARRGGVPPHGDPAVRRPAEVHQGAGDRDGSRARSILLVAQKSAAKDDPGPQDIYAIGSVSNILQMLKLPDGTVKVLVEGGARARTSARWSTCAAHWIAEAAAVPLDGTPAPEVEAMRRALLSAVRPVREAEQEDPARDPDVAVRHRRSRPPRRHGRRAPAAQARAEAAGARDVRRQGRASSTCCRSSRPRSTSCRSRSASAAASSGRWRRASASTT